jgi:hypothetical protein
MRLLLTKIAESHQRIADRLAALERNDESSGSAPAARALARDAFRISGHARTPARATKGRFNAVDARVRFEADISDCGALARLFELNQSC